MVARDGAPLSVARMPPHAPRATQLVAFTALQVKRDLPPKATVVGVADRVIRKGLATTFKTVAALPVSPLAVRQINLSSTSPAESGPTHSDPDAALVPVHPPLAVQD